MSDNTDFDFEFEFAEPESKYGAPKASCHRTGRLGFNLAANELLDFGRNQYWKIGRTRLMGPESAFNNEVLILMPVPEEDDKTFKVQKASGYYSLKARRLWSQMGIDYRNDPPTFDIDEMPNKDITYYKLVKRKK